MGQIYHVHIKKDYAAAIIQELHNKDAVELIPEEKAFQATQWQIDAIRESVQYYHLHPEELISWEDVQYMIKTD